MNEDMNTAELLKELAEENQTRKIILIMETCENLEEALEKIKDLLNK